MTQFSRGSTIGPFIIDKEISSGGMATVYQARLATQVDSFPSHVAIKVAKQGYEDFLRDEEEHLRHLQHPNIIRPVPIPTETGESERKHYIRCATSEGSSLWYLVLEHLAGGSLADLLQFKKKMPVNVAVEIATQVAMALDHLHRVRGVAHLDVRPDNILFRQDPLNSNWRPEVVLCDFGIAWHNKQSPTDSYGDLPYVAPERRRGANVTESCDVYALGIVLYEMLTGARPYPQDEGKTATADATSDFVSPDPPSRYRRISPRLDSVVLRAIARRPGDRYPTVSAFLEDLRPVQLEVAAKPGQRQIVSKQVLRWGIGIFLVCLLGLVSFFAGLRAWQTLPMFDATTTPLQLTAGTEIGALSSPTLTPTLTPSPALPTYTFTPMPTLAPQSALPTVSRPTSTLQPTHTPFTPTLAPTPTALPSPTQRPTATKTPHPSPTPTRPRPTATSKPPAIPALQNPPSQQSVESQVTFSWTWTGNLAPEQYFEVRIRRYPDTTAEYRGVGLPLKERSLTADIKGLVENTANWNNWPGGQVQHGDELWWSVAVVQWSGNAGMKPTLLVESKLRSLKFIGHPGETPVVCNCSEELCGNCKCGQACCIKCCKKCQ